MYSFHKINRLMIAVLAILAFSAGVSTALATTAATTRTIAAGSAAGNVGTEVVIPITINDPAEVGGIAFTLKYDPMVLRFMALEQATAGAAISNGDDFKVSNPAVGDPAYNNPYVTPYETSPSTLFYQFNDVKKLVNDVPDPNQPLGRVLVSGATATPLSGTLLFNARFGIIGGNNGTTYPVELLRSVIYNPAAGYTVATGTFLPVLVGTGPLDTATNKYATLSFPEIPATLVAGGITVTAPTFSLGGKVTYASTPATNAAGSTVTLKRVTAAGEVFNEQTTVNTNGQYSFTGKQAGNYKLVVNSLDPAYNGSELAVTLSGNKTDANIVLPLKPQPARVSGEVTAGYVAGLRVKVVDSSNNVMGVYDVTAGATAGAGTWASALLPPGTYNWYLIYGNLTSAQNATTFNTAQLKSIAGTISGLTGSGAVTAVSVSGKLQKTVQVSDNGAYTIDNLVPANDYIVSLVTSGQPVTYYNGKTDVSQATKVDVSSANGTDVNFTFVPPAGNITGTITDTGGPVAGLTVYGFEVNAFALVQATIGANGGYDMKARPGAYEVFIIKPNGKIFYFYNADGTPTQKESSAAIITVSDGGTAANTNINITEADKTLTGKVTYRTATGDPAVNVLITASNDTQRALALTGQDGTYVLTGLVSGDYTVTMKVLTGNYPVQTEPVTIGSGTNEKNFIIDTGAVLSGTVTESGTTDAVGGAMLFLKDQATGALVGGRVYFSGTDGSYTIRDIQEGSYTLEVTHPDYKSYMVDIAINSDLTQDVALQKGAYFKGAVVDSSNGNAPLNGVTIIVTRADATPVYTVTNSAGEYSVYGMEQSQVYVIIAQKRGYERKAAAGKIPASSGTTVDFALAPPTVTYSVSGTVRTDAASTPEVPGAIVVVSSKSKNFIATTTTAANGAYTIGGLGNASDYRVVVIPGGNLPTQSATFTVAGADVTRDFTIQLGGDIGGTVGPSTTATVYVFLYNGTTYVGYTKAVGGSFLFKGLTAGADYKIMVVAAGFASQWYNGQNSIDTATTIGTGTTNVAITLTSAQ